MRSRHAARTSPAHHPAFLRRFCCTRRLFSTINASFVARATPLNVSTSQRRVCPVAQSPRVFAVSCFATMAAGAPPPCALRASLPHLHRRMPIVRTVRSMQMTQRQEAHLIAGVNLQYMTSMQYTNFERKLFASTERRLLMTRRDGSGHRSHSDLKMWTRDKRSLSTIMSASAAAVAAAQSESKLSPSLRFFDDDILRCSLDEGAAGVLCFELDLFSSRFRCFSFAELSGDVIDDRENMRSPSLTVRLTPEFLS